MYKIKPQVKEIMERNAIRNKGEAIDAIGFVIELLELDIEETREHEPNAKNCIKEMVQAISRVQDLEGFFNGYK